MLKTILDGKVIFSIEHPRTIGIYKDDEPFKPTETTIAPNEYILRIDIPDMYAAW